MNDLLTMHRYIQSEVEKANDHLINSAMTPGTISQVESTVRSVLREKAGANANHVSLRATGQDSTVTIIAENFYTAMLLVGVEVDPFDTSHIDAAGTRYELAQDGSLNIWPVAPVSRITIDIVIPRPVTDLTCQLCGAKVEEIQPLLPDPCNDDPLVRCTECGVEYFTDEGKKP